MLQCKPPPTTAHACSHTHFQPASARYLLPGIRDGLGITLQLFHVAQKLLEEMLTRRLTLQSQVHSQGLQDGTVVAQGGGVSQLGREPGELGQRQWRQVLLSQNPSRTARGRGG